MYNAKLTEKISYDLATVQHEQQSYLTRISNQGSTINHLSCHSEPCQIEKRKTTHQPNFDEPSD